MTKLISSASIGDTIEYLNSNWCTYYKGTVTAIEPTKSGKSYKVTLENVFTKRDKWTGEEHYSIENHGTYKFCNQKISLTIKASVEVEIIQQTERGKTK